MREPGNTVYPSLAPLICNALRLCSRILLRYKLVVKLSVCICRIGIREIVHRLWRFDKVSFVLMVLSIID